jgi:CDP-paratose 2-epimerase
MKVLITGGAGFVGSNLARLFAASRTNVEVTAFDNLKRRGSELNLKPFKELGIRFVHGDIRNSGDLAALGTGFDLFIEASAEASVHAGVRGTPDYVVQTNLFGTFNCLSFARYHADKFVFLSTSRVYSIKTLREIALEETPSRFTIRPEQTLRGVTTAGISEDFDTSLPRSFYGATKLASEYLVQEFTEAYGLKSIVYRCGVLAGPGQFGKTDQGVFTMWVAHHFFKKDLQYTGFGGTGKQVRDLLHPADLFALMERHIDVIDKHSGSVHNVGGGAEISVSLAELTALCQKIVGTKVPITRRADTAAVDVPLYISDCGRISSALGWRPNRDVETIVSDIFSWIRDNESDLRLILT